MAETKREVFEDLLDDAMACPYHYKTHGERDEWQKRWDEARDPALELVRLFLDAWVWDEYAVEEEIIPAMQKLVKEV